MELEPIGRVDNPDDIDLNSITVPIVGYKKGPKGNVEVITKIRFKRFIPYGFYKEIVERGGDLGALTGQEQLDYLLSTVEDDDKDKFTEIVFGNSLYIERSTVREVFKRVDEARAGRPTKPSTGSSPSGRPTKVTSKRVSKSTASPKKRST
jgi:hypothetical protein